MTSHQVQLWGGLAMAGLGALVLLTLIMACVLGLSVRLFHLCAGNAQIARRRRPGRRRGHFNGHRPEATATLADLLDGGAGRDTAPMEAVRDVDR